MKHKSMIAVLAISVAASLWACGAAEDSAKTESNVTASVSSSVEAESESEESTVTEEPESTSVSEESTSAVSTESESEAVEEEEPETDAVANDLPVGYISEQGYYNSFFGFKLRIPSKDNDMETFSKENVTQHVIEWNTMEYEDNGPSDNVEEFLTNLLNNVGFADPYDLRQGISAGGDYFFVSMEVSGPKVAEGKIIEGDTFLNRKAVIAARYAALTEDDVTETEIDMAGQKWDCCTINIDETQNMTNMAVLGRIKDGYVFEITVLGFSDLEAMCSAFEAF